MSNRNGIMDLIKYHKNYYEQSEFWGKSLNDHERERISITLSLLPKDAKTILDIGCGDGRITNEIDEKHKVFAMDMSNEAIRYVKANRILAAITQIPFGDYCFDLSLSSEVLEHLPKDILHEAINEIQRVTEKYILISVPFMENLYANSTRCNECDNVFHVNLHFQSFSKKRLAHLFPSFSPVKFMVFGPEVEYRNNLLLFIERQLGGKWPKVRTALCPECGSKDAGGAKGNILSWIAERLDWRLTKAYPFRKRRWITVLYERIRNEA